MNTQEIRAQYLKFFQDRGHTILPSASLLPENDPTTLFTGSGMQPMISYLLGQPHPQGTRLTDSQKSFRADDIEEVGDNRHTTFFEMLGNWSLGDYFKKEQIPWMFEFLTDTLKLDPRNLYITVFRGNEKIGVPRDEESAKLWQEQFASKNVNAPIIDNAWEKGMQGGRIFYYDAKKNWWSRAGIPDKMPVGEPGGPDAEMFWDFYGEEKGAAIHAASQFAKQPCHVNCDCGRFMEIGNNVFMAYKKTDAGFVPLEKKNVDFGGGLERLAAAHNHNPDVFLLDIFTPARTQLEKLSGKTYAAEQPAHTHAFRVILDHMRAATFLIADGAAPSNKDQGYFTRRLIRRAVRFANQLGIGEMFAAAITETFIDIYKEAYPSLHDRREQIKAEIQKEETKFRRTLEKGIRQFEKLRAKGDITGKDAFDLFTSYGFPVEITLEMAKEAGLNVDLNAFKSEMKKHQDLSRTASKHKFKGGLADHSAESTRFHTATHLTYKALRNILGDHVTQKGSNITPERMRFDFAHPTKLTSEQLKAVEDMVNLQISRDLPVSFEVMTVDEAKRRGAMGNFEERYGDKVKVYTMGDFSFEICGGPHVQHTGELGHYTITKEEAVSAGVRRIKAVLEPKK
ncbi:MAG: alanine--tRNA ligase [Candidatus Kerfeldbacteria bacterium RIFCSPHIGHO2_12_FULL_48_17]|uniref:Alanine--tRNA ligase n=1 Tax=Candidatus Kerfeldbacteria bacterium RIFCSPHIGHO2_12_FULL_48_17 TaxID=1798542 RepID=A0A1G2AXP9_9BACT|nr:MAG: alanine--tRNA ligase [Candidatus Kerfeldbacteria bacterium RIFCSPHIGHO2_12_FULL_48_17]